MINDDEDRDNELLDNDKEHNSPTVSFRLNR
jgi:hypothetical protein